MNRREALKGMGLLALFLAGCRGQEVGEVNNQIGTVGTDEEEEAEPSPTMMAEPTVVAQATPTVVAQEVIPTLQPLPTVTTTEMPPTPETKKRPEMVLGVYLPYHLVSDREKVNFLLESVSIWGANSVVVDIKNESGRVMVPFEHTLKPKRRDYKDDPEHLFYLLELARQKGVHVIGRQVTMLDTRMVKEFPEYGFKENGSQRSDSSGNYWADPRFEAVAEYNATIAAAIAEVGITEVQLDYIRFLNAGVRFYIPYEERVGVINRVLAYAKQALAGRALLTVDFFGDTPVTSANLPDMGIGQDIVAAAPYLDGVCPMLYPDLLSTGRDVDEYGYVYERTWKAVERLRMGGNTEAFVNPWIQAYGPMDLSEIQAQMKGAFDGGALGVNAWKTDLNYIRGLYVG